MHTVNYEFLMKSEESAGCHQTLSPRVGSGHETILILHALLQLSAVDVLVESVNAFQNPLPSATASGVKATRKRGMCAALKNRLWVQNQYS